MSFHATRLSDASSVSHLCASFRCQSLRKTFASSKPASSLPSTKKSGSAVVVAAEATNVTKVKFDGENAGEAALDLKVARSEVAKGIVHKYVVMVRQNARRVRFLPDFPR